MKCDWGLAHDTMLVSLGSLIGLTLGMVLAVALQQWQSRR